MQYMIKLDDYLTDHAIKNMIKILSVAGTNIKNMHKEDIMQMYGLNTDMEFYNFMVDFDSFFDSYDTYDKKLKDLIASNKTSRKVSKRT